MKGHYIKSMKAHQIKSMKARKIQEYIRLTVKTANITALSYRI